MEAQPSSSIVKGLLLCLAIAAPAWFAGMALPVVGGAVFGLAFGMLAGLLRPIAASRAGLEPGIRFTGRNILRWSIILLGFQMQIGTVLQVGARSLFVMLFTMAAAFATAALLWKALRVPGKLAALIGVGTAICGGSAIAAAAPAIRAGDEDVAQSISTIFLFNVAAVFAFPALGRALGLSDHGFGVWAGTAVNDSSSVVAAASVWSGVSGNDDALALATIVKLTRTLMIVPITLALSLYTARKDRQAGDAAGGFSFAKAFPWFVLGFLAAALAASILPIPAALSSGAATVGKFMIVMAMAAIGLSTDFRKMAKGGWKPPFLGFCCWVAVASVSLLAQALTGAL